MLVEQTRFRRGTKRLEDRIERNQKVKWATMGYWPEIEEGRSRSMAHGTSR